MGPVTTKEIGDRAEQVAADFLVEHHGYRIVARNFHARGGEVDLVAFDGDVLCFVEVRSRKNDDYGDPLETISPKKMRRIAKAARQYLGELRGPWPQMRFDAVGITMTDPPRIELVRDAFEA